MGPTGPTGPVGIQSGNVTITFGGTSSSQGATANTNVSTTTYQNMWLRGFSNTSGASAGPVLVGAVYFDNAGSTWLAGMLTSANENPDNFAVYYYYL
jgi:hypothetical protein